MRSLVSPNDAAKYDAYAVRSYVEENRNMSWCTGANCDNAMECLIERTPDEPLDVICTCTATFCFNCKQEAHRPVSTGFSAPVGGGEIGIRHGVVKVTKYRVQCACREVTVSTFKGWLHARQVGAACKACLHSCNKQLWNLFCCGLLVADCVVK